MKCFEDNSLIKTELEKEGRGRVLLVDGGGSMRRALAGGAVAAIAQKNGWGGLVIHGCIRDVEEIFSLPICIMALGVIPLPPIKKNEGSIDLSLNMFGFWIRPGEFITADQNGILVVPKTPVSQA